MPITSNLLLKLCRFLLDNNANVHAQTQTGDTALAYACENGHTDVAEVLLMYGAVLEHESEGGRTPLMKACRAGHLCTVKFLLSRGANVNKQTINNDHTPLSLACAGGHQSVVELLLANNADPFHRLKDNSTMLIEAAKGGHINVVQLLLDYPQSLTSTQYHMAMDTTKMLTPRTSSNNLDTPPGLAETDRHPNQKEFDHTKLVSYNECVNNEASYMINTTTPNCFHNMDNENREENSILAQMRLLQGDSEHFNDEFLHGIHVQNKNIHPSLDNYQNTANASEVLCEGSNIALNRESQCPSMDAQAIMKIESQDLSKEQYMLNYFGDQNFIQRFETGQVNLYLTKIHISLYLSTAWHLQV